MEAEKHNTPGFQELSAIQADLIRRKQALERERKVEVEAWQKKLEMGLATRQSLDEAAYEVEGKPVGDLFHDRLSISNREWAERICSASSAFAVNPGFQVLVDRPLPPEGEVFDHGLRVFMLAGTVTPLEVEGLLEQGRSDAGFPQWTPDQGTRQLSEVELGVWTVLRQLHRYFDGAVWGPPLRSPVVTKPRAVIPDGTNPAATIAGPTGNPRLPALSPALEDVWNALERRALSVDQIIRHLQELGRTVTAGSVRQSVSRLKKRERKVHVSHKGYFRPDAPPDASNPLS